MIRARTQEALSRNVNFFPRRTYMGSAGIAVPEQKLQLVNSQNADTAITLIRPPVKPPLGQSFMTKPEPLAVIRQRPNGRSSPVPENEDAPRKWVHAQDMTAYPGQPVYPFAEVNRLDSQKNPHLRRELDHDQNPCSISPSDGRAPVADTCNRPPSARIHSICHWPEPGLPTSKRRN